MQNSHSDFTHGVNKSAYFCSELHLHTHIRTMTEQEQIIQLREELHQHNYNYYVLNMPIISDFDFDMKMHRLEELEALHPELFDPNSPTQRVGNDHSNAFLSVTHKSPMLSLANTYNRDEVRDFYEHIREGLGGEDFQICCELKFDGLSISLHYTNGVLEKAVTRGDGVTGDDVTENIRTIRSIPLVLPKDSGYPDSFEIRGEVLMPWNSFDRLNQLKEEAGEPPFANPRNAASGTLKSKSSAVVAKRGLDAYLYYVLADNSLSDEHYQNLQMARTWGFQVSNDIKIAKNLKEIYDYIDYWNTERRRLPIATDGIVLKVNSLRQQKVLGLTAKNPKWAIAYKFQAEQEETILRQVVYQVGRTGAVTPVANMEPVLLSGTIVRRATLHNADMMESLHLHLNDHVLIEKGGEIIPKIVGRKDMEETEHESEELHFIDKCPVCGTPLVRYEGEAAHYCPNENACPPLILGRIKHFISRKAMNIGSLGPETVDEYFSKGIIRNAADLYDLNEELLAGPNGEEDKKSIQKLLANISQSKHVPFERVLYAIGIRFVGEIAAKTLARYFKNIDTIAKARLEELLDIEGIGPIIAQSVIRFFQDPENLLFVQRLRGHGVSMEIISQDEGNATHTLQGKSIVISGVFARHSRDEYKAIIERNGGKNAGNISAKTSFVLAGENMGPSKLEKANKLNIPIMNEEEFLSLIEAENGTNP